VFCGFAISIATEHLALAEIKDIAHLDILMPNASTLIRGRGVRIAAKISMVSYPEEPIESTALLTVNGQSFRPFYTIITPGEITLSQEFAWFSVARGNNMAIRFRLILIGNISRNGYEAVDVTRDYKVENPPHRRRKRICRCKEQAETISNPLLCVVTYVIPKYPTMKCG
jgi:hypothetical protein